MIHLIPKTGGSDNDISKWRPITLFNTVYKLLAKIVARHLTPLLPQLIHPSQTCFVRNRSILDNLFSFWEVVALAKRTNNKVAVVLLDFEKAYDRVCWNFLETVMGKLSFRKTWIKSIEGLYRNGSSCVHWHVKGVPFSEYPDLYDRDAHYLHPYFYYTPK